MNLMRRACTFLLALALAGCASAPITRTGAEADPWEPMNRGLFQVHEALDKVILKQTVTVYTFITPQFVRTGVSNFFNNIDDLFSGVNDLLQAKTNKAGDDFGRVLLNSTFGLGGLLDLATEAGIERGMEDFGQTFAVWGLPQGPFLFVPGLGPSTIRDFSGTVVRLEVGPAGYINDIPVRNVIYGLGVVDARYQAGDALDIATQAALDKYTFLRNAYLQRRRYLIYDGKVPPEQEDKP